MARILSIENRILASQYFPPEQRATILAPTRYHEDLEQQFQLVRDDSRFALGWAWICCQCGEEATTIEAWAPETRVWLLVKAACRQCGRYFLHPGAFRFVTEETLALDEDDLCRYWVIMMQSWAHYAMSEEV